MSALPIFRRRAHAARRSLPAMDWMDDVTGRCARATAIGNRRLLVENYTAIIAFSDERIRLDTGGGALCVTGRDLSLREVRSGSLIVRGEIHRVDLPCEGGGAPDER